MHDRNGYISNNNMEMKIVFPKWYLSSVSARKVFNSLFESFLSIAESERNVSICSTEK